MALDPQQGQQLQEALLRAFPNRAALTQMVSFGLGQTLEVIAGGDTLEQTVFQLIQWASAHGRVPHLVRAALAQNADNPDLRLFATQTGLLDDQERNPSTPIAREQTSSLLPNLGYRKLVGRDALLEEILLALGDVAGRWIVAIDGMGGIGKTALARETADRCLRERSFEMLIWESSSVGQAQSSGYLGMPTINFSYILDVIGRRFGLSDISRMDETTKEEQIGQLLHKQKVLLVLDNMETMHEQDVIALRLQRLLGYSKAIFTSRHHFSGDVYTVHLMGLDEVAAVELLHEVASDTGFTRIRNAKVSDLRKIARTTGGSPLALKLVVGQLRRMPLSKVLEHLQTIRPAEAIADNEYLRMYKHIFMPSWRLLSPDGRRLLIALSLFPPSRGGTFESLQATSSLPDAILTHSLDELWQFSLLEINESRDLEQVRYYLHPLTRYFVQADIVHLL